MKDRIKIGTCGFRSPKDEYMKLLSCVEIQHTFYQPPQIATLERWRAEAPDGFEFTLKAWQLITHESKSPTYKRLKKKLSDEELREAGYFKPTAIVKEAWETTRACSKALKARTVLFQCPASFKSTDENIENLYKFFLEIDRGKLNFCWEPRGSWSDEVVKTICTDLNLWHVVDPFAKTTVTPDKCYYRLHGRTGWRYQYEDGELEELVSLLPKKKLSYVFFNNIAMTDDALRFQGILKELSP
ncbi:MAG: DUF72 domain-containing protein [Acidobacteriota bacterium]|nr:DUF72 domain-containing protein [Acidobacteriota bacterium]